MKVKPPTVFGGNERVSHEAIIEVQRAETLLRVKAEEQVLLVQDTTSFNFSHHPATAGLGPLENAHCRGFLAHSTLAVSRVGVPLGLMEQQVWVRHDEDRGKRHQRHERAFAEKESYKWVKGFPKTDGTQGYVVVCDAEAHIYEFLWINQKGDYGCRMVEWQRDKFNSQQTKLLPFGRQKPRLVTCAS